MIEITPALQAVRARITAALATAGRGVSDCELIAVSKTKPASAIAQAAAAGQRHFGENYLQEALNKREELDDPSLIWHFIGAIQSNKTRDIAENFAWVHTVEREKIARRLSDQRPEDLPPLNVLIQVNLQDEASKAGVSPSEVVDLAGAISQFPGIRLRGLMAIPAPTEDPDEQRAVFEQLKALNDEITKNVTPVDTLSMGMTGDMEVAIAAGATFVRIGTAIFGSRNT